jgi:hypothetical protein
MHVYIYILRVDIIYVYILFVSEKTAINMYIYIGMHMPHEIKLIYQLLIYPKKIPIGFRFDLIID